MSAIDYYRVLNVDKGASGGAIESAFQNLVKRFQSADIAGHQIVSEKFRQIKEAHFTLSDPARRREYDKRNGFAAQAERRHVEATADLGSPNLFQSPALKKWFAGDTHRDLPRRQMLTREYPASDIDMALSISFTEALSGCEKRLKVRRCGRTEEILASIPAGAGEGQVVRIAGKGEPCSRGDKVGDLLVTVHIVNETSFYREGDDVVVHKGIRFSEAILGTVVDVATLGESFRVRVPAGVQCGTRLTVKGQGMYSRETNRRGDLFVQVSVQVPEALTPEQAQAVAVLAGLGL